MQRPEVRVIDQQSEKITDTSASQAEINYLLSKYGYANNSNVTSPNQPVKQDPNANLTFEQILALQNKPTNTVKRDQAGAVSFDNRNVRHSETKYQDMDIDNAMLGIKITIVSDMKF